MRVLLLVVAAVVVVAVVSERAGVVVVWSEEEEVEVEGEDDARSSTNIMLWLHCILIRIMGKGKKVI